MWERIFERVVRDIVRQGRLRVTLPGGRRLTAGKGGPEIGVEITDPVWMRRITLNPDMGLGEGYMEGGIRIADDDLRGLMELLIRNVSSGNRHWMQSVQEGVRRRARSLGQWNPMERARRNVAHHHDLSSELYDIFLDRDRQYSCAYFRSPKDSLDAAQAQKKAHVAAKLMIEPGMNVLDIGCGWGGLALTLARDHGARVTGVTLSREQHALAARRAAAEGLAGRVRFLLQDYRTLTERFDRVVSIGMFEHVGVPHCDEYFGKLNAMLDPGGLALVHTIGRTGPPGITSPFIAKYIFPGGYVPALSEMAAAIELQNLFTTDLEVWRLHYAETLRHWETRFMGGIARSRALYDDRFCRMRRHYLVASEMTFRHGGQVVFQAQLAHRKDAVPITRDYLHDREPPARHLGMAAAAG